MDTHTKDDVRPPPEPNFCAFCNRPMPVTLLDAAFYLAGDPELNGRPREFAQNLAEILARGLDLSQPHRDQLIELYHQRHGLNADAYRQRRARIVGAADAS